mgnify:CR=1 FL=1|tara:strand:- start:437 stop:988 length:552 start_codon:yes stop_codon:yes gene_type:complete
MNNKLIIGFITLCISLGLYFINLSGQKSYSSSSSNLTNIKKEDIQKILIQNKGEALELMRIDSIWNILGHNSLIMKEQALDNLFDKVLNLQLQTIMTKKEEKWDTFNVGDSTGTHLALIDFNDKTVAYFVFGRSNSDFSRCYVRESGTPTVYLADDNVIYNMQTRAEYWGEQPKEDIPIPIVE